MSQEPQLPSESERKAFVQKLGEFRSTLPPNEQRMLDAMAVAAFSSREQSDVQGYGAWFATGPYTAQYVPTFYQTGVAQVGWGQTWWGQVYPVVSPTGFYR